MATAVNARDVALAAISPRMNTVALPTNTTLPFDQVNGASKPANNATVGATWSLNLSGQPTALVQINSAEGTKLSGIATGADVTLSAVNGGLTLTGGGLTLSAGGAIKGGQTAFNTGTGFFLGFSGGAYKFSIGNSAGANMTWDGTTLALGGATNLDIAGQVNFDGAFTLNAQNAAVHVNISSLGVVGGATHGLVAYTNNAAGYAFQGFASGASGIGLRGVATGAGVGVAGEGTSGTAGDFIGGASGIGVHAMNVSLGGTALFVDGPTVANNSTLVANWNSEKLGGNTAAAFVLYQNVVDTGNPGTPTHALHCILGATAFRIPVLIP